jgi:glycosyltransferase involved in cell wall biosynthesis
MRIGIDGGCLANRRGFGRFARRTLQALADQPTPHTFVVLIDAPSVNALDAMGALPETAERRVVPVRYAPSQAASSRGRRSVRDLLAMSRSAARAGLDLLYFPATYSYFPVWGVPRVVVTMHDTLALARPELVFPTRAGRVAWAVKEHAAVRQADRIVTVSDAARRDLVSWFKLPEDRVDVVSEAADPAFTPRPEGAESDGALRRCGLDPGAPFFLYVGGLSPHKNLPRLIAAFAASGLDARGYRLVLVGDVADVFHTHLPTLRGEIERLGLGDCVVFTGFVADDDLAFLYSRAEALVQPSLMEGFGLPPVEAMACGAAVLASTAGSLPEVVGDAGLFFNPHDTSAISAALVALADRPELRVDLRRRALARAGLFSWDHAARSLLACFERLDPTRAASGRRRSA